MITKLSGSVRPLFCLPLQPVDLALLVFSTVAALYSASGDAPPDNPAVILADRHSGYRPIGSCY
jgi:hypothetical protein